MTPRTRIAISFAAAIAGGWISSGVGIAGWLFGIRIGMNCAPIGFVVSFVFGYVVSSLEPFDQCRIIASLAGGVLLAWLTSGLGLLGKFLGYRIQMNAGLAGLIIFSNLACLLTSSRIRRLEDPSSPLPPAAGKA